SLIVCDNCGEEEWRLTCTIKKSKRQFCDMECKSEYGWIDGRVESEYHKQKQLEAKDAKLKKKDKVKKRCMRCNIIYYGPPGDFPKSRDPKIPEPGLCDDHSKTIPYDEGESAGVVRI
ncbi:unnamed protein product, partial [marine sediment metagenome]